jgi:DNA primase large subunit
MFRQETPRIHSKRRANFDHKRKQFAPATFQQIDYPHRLNLYDSPPTSEITLEQFEQWAIDRLKSTYTPSLTLSSFG